MINTVGDTTRPRPQLPADGAAGLIRIARMTARPGMLEDLVIAAHANAADARRTPGCRSAEVCTVPDEPDQVRVISRWDSPEALHDFLAWHEQQAHETITPAAAATPTAVHLPVVPVLTRL